mmetsp:Transcript_6295/g.14772  ORF Transcript_6295/g.14772 Transcript_6295/m.14772 type:complete len:334 (+) Transcript_6295:831-1832(+)
MERQTPHAHAKCVELALHHVPFFGTKSRRVSIATHRVLDISQKHVDDNREDVVETNDEHESRDNSPRSSSHSVYQCQQLRQGTKKAHQTRKPQKPQKAEWPGCNTTPVCRLDYQEHDAENPSFKDHEDYERGIENEPHVAQAVALAFEGSKADSQFEREEQAEGMVAHLVRPFCAYGRRGLVVVCIHSNVNGIDTNHHERQALEFVIAGHCLPHTGLLVEVGHIVHLFVQLHFLLFYLRVVQRAPPHLPAFVLVIISREAVEIACSSLKKRLPDFCLTFGYCAFPFADPAVDSRLARRHSAGRWYYISQHLRVFIVPISFASWNTQRMARCGV